VASVGVAPNKFVAKIASDIDKPDGFVAVAPDQVQAFLDPLPVGRLWGVGKVGARVFERLGIASIGQLRAYSLRLLQQHFGNFADQLWQLAHGADERPVVSEREARSISQETTFPRDIDDRLKGRTVQLKVRLADFSTLTRAQTLAQPTDISDEIRRAALGLFEQRLPRPLPPLRLLGIGVSGFAESHGGQADLFAAAERERQSRIDAVMDQVAERYGRGSLVRGGRRGPG